MNHWLFWHQPRSWRHRAFAREACRLRSDPARLFLRYLYRPTQDDWLREELLARTGIRRRLTPNGLSCGYVLFVKGPSSYPLPRK